MRRLPSRHVHGRFSRPLRTATKWTGPTRRGQDGGVLQCAVPLNHEPIRRGIGVRLECEVWTRCTSSIRYGPLEFHTHCRPSPAPCIQLVPRADGFWSSETNSPSDVHTNSNGSTPPDDQFDCPFPRNHRIGDQSVHRQVSWLRHHHSTHLDNPTNLTPQRCSHRPTTPRKRLCRWTLFQVEQREVNGASPLLTINAIAPSDSP